MVCGGSPPPVRSRLFRTFLSRAKEEHSSTRNPKGREKFRKGKELNKKIRKAACKAEIKKVTFQEYLNCNV